MNLLPFCRLVATVLCCSALLLLFESPASAQQERQEFEDTIHVVQRKPVLQKGRVDFSPRIGMSINDSVYQSFKVGVNANYHLTESMYLGGLFEWYNFGEFLGGPTSEFEALQNETQAFADAPVLNWVGGLEFGYKPLVGKFALFNSGIVFYDFAVTLGGAYINNTSVALPAEQSNFGGTLSLTGRVFLNDWMAVNLELRDIMFVADLRGQENAFSNVVTFSAGASFYLPTSFEYSKPAEQEEDAE